MGVHGLWELLAPVGRRVSVETLAGKKLAIDASIWMVQFMKAMRDEKGEMVRNAHILGFFRRICKLLFLRTKPVFVFDGGTPALKRRTVIARRRQRDNAQAKIRKTAEKLLLNHLKSMRLKELAEEVENKKKNNSRKGKKAVTENAEVEDKDDNCKSDDNDRKGKNVVSETDEPKDTSAKIVNDDRKGKKVVVEDDEMNDSSRWKSDDEVDEGYDQETLDAMLAASLAAEEDGSLTGYGSTSVGGGIASAEDDGDEDEEMILPVMDGNVDPAVLAALPPSMQLDLLVQMRERLMAENRQKYQKVKKAPEKFSQLQIQSYLKTVAFRREIDQVQKSAAGRGVGGVQTSRIASEANREYIFSSSFTGDKQTLMSGGVEKNENAQDQTTGKRHISSDSVDRFSSLAQSSSATGPGVGESRTGMDDDVETYLDERGRIRVSRVRAMGIRMTRDLQRNLDLMKETEKEKMKENNYTDTEAIFNKIVLGVDNQMKASVEETDELSILDEGITMSMEDKTLQVPENITGMEISFFEDDKGKKSTEEDDLFAHLVAGNSVTPSSLENDPLGKHSPVTASDCSWQEGSVGEKVANFTNDVEEESLPSRVEGNVNGENEVEWEEGVCDVLGNGSPYSSVHKEAVAKGSLEEEAHIQEAIRRSLEDFTKEKTCMSAEKEKLETSKEMGKQNLNVHVSGIEEETVESFSSPVESHLLESQTARDAVKLDYVGEEDLVQVDKASERQMASSIVVETKTDAKTSVMQNTCERRQVPCVRILTDTTSECSNVNREKPSKNVGSSMEPIGVHLVTNSSIDNLKENGVSFSGANSCKDSSQVSAVVMDEITRSNLLDVHQNDFETSQIIQTQANLVDAYQNDSGNPALSHSFTTTNSVNKSSKKEIETSVDFKQELDAKENFVVDDEEIRHIIDNSQTQENVEVQLEFSGARLDEEMLYLRQERMDLGDEQRKLERNAESVSSEMFAECQELLQMFGLPYIVAPMEAEAQCAYMELESLVDGVVTDDSDVFLFGARSVYKNIFDDRKYVETYFMKDIESELGLTRQQLVRMALLLGSDYTEGVSGIGIVNAIEVVNAFPEEDGLQKFREWLESPDPNILGNLGSPRGLGSRKKGSKVINTDCSKESVEGGSANNENVSESDHDDVKQMFMDKHRNVSKNWHIPSSFPSEAVISAYVSPQVDRSTDPFAWGRPDLLVLRKLCWEKFGWSNQKADELLVPVLKEYNKHETQLRLEAFYTFNERFAKIRSQRIKKAVKGITGKRSSELMDDISPDSPKSTKAKRMSSSGRKGNKEKPSDLQYDNMVDKKSHVQEISTPTQSRGKKIDNIAVSPEVGHSEASIQKKTELSTTRGSGRNGRGRGIGRGRGRGRGRDRGRAAGKGGEEDSDCESETSSDQGSDHNDKLQIQVENTEKQLGVRRSTRSRKHSKYTEDDLGTDGPSNSLDHDKACIDEAMVQEQIYNEENFREVPEILNEKDSDPSLNDHCLRDYLEIGGGFCLDEGEDNNPDQLARCPDRDDNEFSVDYLAAGGGFCVEDDQGAEPVQSFSGPQRDLDGTSIGSPASSQNPHSPNKGGNSGSKNMDFPPPGNEVQKVDSAPTGLTAMPFLRRKRRKT